MLSILTAYSFCCIINLLNKQILKECMAKVELICWQYLTRYFPKYMHIVAISFHKHCRNIFYCLLLSSNIDVNIPRATSKNGTLFAHIFLHPQGSQPLYNERASYSVAPLTKFVVERSRAFNLMSDDSISNKVSHVYLIKRFLHFYWN